MTPAAGTDAPVVVLCGFMGTGKSSVGQRLARRLGVEFIDTDAIVEQRAGKSIVSIFDSEGESHFRMLETDVCRMLDPDAGAVIATGGGMVMNPRNLLHLQSLGTTVLLEASVDAILARAGSSGDRPLLAGTRGDAGARARVESLLESRRSVYEQCELRLDTTHRTVEESALDLAEMIEARMDGGRALIPLRVDTRPIPGSTLHPGNARLSRVVAGAGVTADLARWLGRLGSFRSAAVLAPVALDQPLARVRAALDAAGIPHHVIPLDDGDARKTLEQIGELTAALASAGAGRDTVAITVGGGVTGDVGGFTASMYMRGVPFVQVPTTLLAQVDAGIGGKVGVNHAGVKNLIGAVYQPHLVLIDPDHLATLPRAEVANGMAEVIKTAIIGSAGLFERLSRRTPFDDAFFADVVPECARIKGRVVERDPYERDERRVLNLGHTLGHGLESALDYKLSHGAAVGLGMLASWRVAIARRAAERRWLDETRAILERSGLPVDAPAVDADRIRAAVGLDKKRRAGRLTFVLPIRPGQVTIVDDVTDDELINAMRD